ncbi:hypothetical protein GKZ89_05505 [Bacillus mangrovi]|uniref:YtpI-like protein n=1 Tax=Metabacillus mangrovi TaxID=1491830 RepID=A0A7X2V480_9BACI|nr:YtpI family protein [Metabacillus mangrovi]MTH52859.1 hypothetical protein [Metabacillus mangrovi]
MPILAFFIIVSFGFYLTYKVKHFRSKKPLQRAVFSGKSSMSLGVFVFLFGLNQFFLYPSTVSISIGILFMILGAGSMWAGFRSWRHYKPLADKEAENGFM